MLLKSTWIVARKLENDELYDQLREYLDYGEAEAIALAVEVNGDLLIMDERLGRLSAKQHGVKIIGLLGISTRTELMRHYDLVDFEQEGGKKRRQHRSVGEAF